MTTDTPQDPFAAFAVAQEQRALRERADRSQDLARASIARLTGRRLAESWMATNAAPMTAELAVVRGWLMDELQNRMTAPRFNAWIDAECTAPAGIWISPLRYLPTAPAA
ncbi:hypothetical protein [Streptacidiphilus sp. EB103A]|uniref:hypothetical protein n=1 Tax=Streptacidiphilus sp. EB103A TaxID=3156275 RepID=UPI003513A8DF